MLADYWLVRITNKETQFVMCNLTNMLI